MQDPHPFDRFMNEEPDWDAPAEDPRARHARLRQETDGAAEHFEPCKRCNGSGQFRGYTGRVLGPCRACQGQGRKVFKTAPEVRARARERAAERREIDYAAWVEAHPTEHAWIVAKAERFEFAAAMLTALAKYGDLTERQLATVQRLARQDAERDAARAERDANAPEINTAPLEAAFDTARDNHIPYPKLPLTYVNPADEHDVATFFFKASRKGPIYVTEGGEDGEYRGKIVEGRFLRVRSCDAETEARIVAICADPRQAAVAYGQKFGRCCKCGKTLTNHASIEAGIGPICARKYGW